MWYLIVGNAIKGLDHSFGKNNVLRQTVGNPQIQVAHYIKGLFSLAQFRSL